MMLDCCLAGVDAVMCCVATGKEFQNRTIQVELARRKVRMNTMGGRGGRGKYCRFVNFSIAKLCRSRDDN